MIDNSEGIAAYRRSMLKKTIFIIAMAAIVILLSGYSCTLSGRSMTLMEGLDAILARFTGDIPDIKTPEGRDYYMVWNITMPRVTFAIIGGAGLAVAGVMMQGVMNNPLADPYTTGVSSGAVFGAVLAIILGINVIPGVGEMGLIANAFFFALVPIGMLMMISAMSKRVSPVVVILAGMAISYFFSGITTIIKVSADDDALADAYRWQIGSLEGISWDQIPLVAIIVLVCTIFVSLTYGKLNSMSAGDDVARSLGINVNRFRVIVLAVTTLMAASIIAYAGVIGFVGLVIPHLLRMIVGGDNKFLIPASMVCGAALLMFADVISRLTFSIDLPVGAVMSFIGAPIFLYLVASKRGKGVYRWRTMLNPRSCTTVSSAGRSSSSSLFSRLLCSAASSPSV